MIRRPAVFRQIVGDGAKDIRQRVPDIAPPVAVLVDRVSQIAGRNELRLPHGAGPRTLHGFKLDIALVDHTQRRQQLLLEKAGAPAVVGQRRQRRHHRVLAGILAVKALDPPDRQDKAGLHAVFLADPVQKRRMLGQHLLAALCLGVGHHLVAVLREGHREFWLLAVALQDGLHRLKPGQRRVQRRLADALRRRFGAEFAQPFGPISRRSRLCAASE